MKLRVTRDDVLRTKTFPADWYEVEITGYEEKASNAGDSTNMILEFTIVSGEFQGGKLFRLFSEKAPGFAIPFLEAIGVAVDETGGDFDLSATKGRKLKVYNKPQTYQGNLRNNVEGFAAL